MTTRATTIVWAFVLTLIVPGPAFVRAADRDEMKSSSPLAIHQEGLSTRMGTLQEKILRLTQKLRKDDPARADALLQAVKNIKEKKLQPRMKEISTLLNHDNFHTATSEQQAIIRDIRNIIDSLTKRDSYYEQLQKEIEQLQQWRKRVNQLSREEWQQKRNTEKLSDLKKAKQRLADQIRQAKKLHDQQRSVLKQTRKTRETGQQNFSSINKQQKQIQKKTRKLAQQLGKKGSQLQSPPESRQPEPGQKSLKQASQHQKNSSDKLTARKGASAEKAQKKAMEDLTKALKKLRQEKKRLASLSPEDMKQMAQKQRQTKRKTRSLQKQMKRAEMGQTPKTLQSATDKMSSASKQLGRKNPQTASDHQTKAHKKLQKARQQIDRKLSELRNQQRSALLSKLINMFDGMLNKHKQITEETVELDMLKSDGTWSRAHRVRCAALADGESDLATTGRTALQMMLDNGSPVVFPRVARGLIHDLTTTSKRLSAEKTGSGTNELQKEIQKTLEDFLAALRMARDNPPPRKSKGKKGNRKKKPPLINLLAELKLLRNLQKRVNSRTTALAEEAPDSPHRVKKLHPLADSQKNVLDMATELRNKLETEARRNAPGGGQ